MIPCKCAQAKLQQGDCTEHAMLLAALLRADDIPSRVRALARKGINEGGWWQAARHYCWLFVCLLFVCLLACVFARLLVCLLICLFVLFVCFVRLCGCLCLLVFLLTHGQSPKQ